MPETQSHHRSFQLSPMETRSFPHLLPEDSGEKIKHYQEATITMESPFSEQETGRVERIKRRYRMGRYRRPKGASLKGKGKIEHDEDTRIPIPSPDYAGSSLVEKCSMRKVHSGLRDVSAKHYEPVLLSIGAYHHGDTPLQEMEKHKVHYRQVLLDRANRKKSSNIGHNNIELEVEALKNAAALAVHCYQHQDMPLNLSDQGSLRECILLDGCFMIELLRRNQHLVNQCLYKKYGKECKLDDEYLKDIKKDVLFNIKWMKPCLARDMLLLENQIPLFVLRKVFASTEQIRPADVDYEFVNLSLRFFEFRGKPVPYNKILIHQLDNTPHLLGLVYNALVPEAHPQQPDHDECKSSSCESIRSAMALKKAGVKFVKARDSEEFYRIVFINGVMSIPRLVINANTETIFRNFIAYEQCTKHYSLHQVMDYLIVMDCLINSDKDVELLRHCGIIDNKIGDDVKVSTMFNKLCSNVYFDENNFFYAQMFYEVNKFCEKRWNKWMANIASNASKYFSGPWSLCSFLAAVTLLVLTATDGVYSIFLLPAPKLGEVWRIVLHLLLLICTLKF